MADYRIHVVYQFKTKMQHARITCQACRRIVILPPALAVEIFGGLTLIDLLEKRLRCFHCGEKKAQVNGVYRERH